MDQKGLNLPLSMMDESIKVLKTFKEVQNLYLSLHSFHYCLSFDIYGFQSSII